jgi:hypothetical protein
MSEVRTALVNVLGFDIISSWIIESLGIGIDNEFLAVVPKN